MEEHLPKKLYVLSLGFPWSLRPVRCPAARETSLLPGERSRLQYLPRGHDLSPGRCCDIVLAGVESPGMHSPSHDGAVHRTTSSQASRCVEGARRQGGQNERSFPIGPIIGVVVFLVVMVAHTLCARDECGTERAGAGWVGAPAQRSGDAEVNCSRLITPERVGPEAFAQYGLAEKLQKGEFVGGEFLGYLYCSHGQPDIQDVYFYADVDILYMFDAESGDLALTSLEWTNPSPPPRPTATPKAIPTTDPNAVTVCMDGGTPLVETGGEEPKQLAIWDILGGNCGVDMSSRICFVCGDGARLLVPAAVVPEDEMPSLGTGETMCIDATTATALQAEAGGEVVEVAAPEACSFQLGGGEGMCWICGEVEAAPLPSAAPTEGVARDPMCAEYVTEQEIGAEEWARYGIAEKLGEDRLQRHWNEGSDVVVCYGHRGG